MVGDEEDISASTRCAAISLAHAQTFTQGQELDKALKKVKILTQIMLVISSKGDHIDQILGG